MTWLSIKIKIVAVALISLLSLFHASGAGASTPVTTIVWSYWGDIWEKEINQKIIQVFESEHPHIRIKSRHRTYSEYPTAIQAWRQNNDMPDVLFLSHIEPYVNADHLVSLTPYIERESYRISDFYPQLLALFTFNGQVYGFPRDNDTQVVFYNKRHFRRKNIEFPVCGWKWDDLLTTARALTDKATGQFGFAFQQDAIEQLYLHFGDDNYHQEKNIGGSFFSSSHGQNTLKRFLQIQADVGPPALIANSNQLAELFVREEVSMIMGNHTLIPKLDTEVAWGVVCLPGGHRRMNRLGGAGYSISKQSPNKQAAWEFLSWLSGPTAQAIYVESASIFPARISVSQSDFYRRQLGSANVDVFLEEMRYALFHSSFDEHPQLHRDIATFLDSTLIQKTPFHKALLQFCHTCVEEEENANGN